MLPVRLIHRLLYSRTLTPVQLILKNRLLMPVLNSSVEAPYPSRLFLMRNLYGMNLSAAEIGRISAVVHEHRPCRFLVFGLGNDSIFWHRINRGGETVFLEDKTVWFDFVTKQNPDIRAYLVDYTMELSNWKPCLDSPETLQMKLPAAVENREWDIILVDAPMGVRGDDPGRMQSIYTASLIRSAGADVFVHDCNREVERECCDRFLGTPSFSGGKGKLRHYSWNTKAAGS